MAKRANTPSLPERLELKKLVKDGVFAVPDKLFDTWDDDRCKRFLDSYRSNPYRIKSADDEGEHLLIDLLVRRKLVHCRARAGRLIATGKVLVNGKVRSGPPLEVRAKGTDKIALR